MCQVVALMRVTGQCFEEVMKMPVVLGLQILHAHAVAEGAETQWAVDLAVEAIARRAVVQRGFEVALDWD